MAESNNCPICGICENDDINKMLPASINSNLHLCKICGLLFYKPISSSQDDLRINFNEYCVEQRESDYTTQYREGKRIYHWLENEGMLGFGAIYVVIIGYDFVGLVDYFDEMDCRVLGIESGLSHLQVEEKTSKIKQGGCSDLDTNLKIDVLIYYNQLEKIKDSNLEIEYFLEYVDKHTVLYIEAAGAKKHFLMKERFYFRQNEYCFFSLRTLVNMLRPFGFKLIKGSESIKALFKLGEDNGSFKSDYREIKKYLILSGLVIRVISFYRQITAYLKTILKY